MVNLIPPNIFHAAASATKDLSRVFTPWSHAVALIYQQLTKTESLNGVCDAARVHASQWQELRGAVPPRKNTFSNANQHRDPAMMESLYWAMKDHLLLRFLKFLAKWKLSFSRPAGVVRASVWVRRKVVQLLEMYGTAGGWKSDAPKPKPLYLQGFLPFTMSPVG